MAKATYIGVDGVARKAKKGYIGVDGVARKIKKVYIGVNGVAMPCWASVPAGMAELNLTVQDAAGKPVQGVLIDGMTNDSGGAVVTNAAGVASGYVAAGSATVGFSGYADVSDASDTDTYADGGSYSKVLSVTTVDFLKLTSSKSLKFSGNVAQLDVTAVGGGGGGYAGNYYDWQRASGGGGGGGGSCVVKESVEFEPHTSYQASVGSGGAINGGAGGKSSFLGVEATGGGAGGSPSSGKGGAGGAGNGAGGNGAATKYSANNQTGGAGVAGSVAGYSSFTETVVYGGGGGGGGAQYELAGKSNGGAGAGYGGKGATAADSSVAAKAGTNGFGGGGGGGSKVVWDNDGYMGARTGAPAKGGSGCIAIRMHLKSA